VQKHYLIHKCRQDMQKQDFIHKYRKEIDWYELNPIFISNWR
jgi:hypothetical protein